MTMANGTQAYAVRADAPEKDNPLRTAEMTLEDDYGMIDGVINNGRRGEELEKAREHAERTQPEKKPSIRERLAAAKQQPRPAPEKKPPELGGTMSRGVKWRLEWAFFLGENGRRQYNRLCKGCVHPCKQSFRAVVLDCPHFQSQRVKKGVDKGGKRAK